MSGSFLERPVAASRTSMSVGAEAAVILSSSAAALSDRSLGAEPASGALNFGLKTFARAMHANGLIETSWGDSKVDGLGAMTGAWWCDSEVAATGGKLTDLELMREIAAYNEVVCKVMMEMIRYLRVNH